MLRPPLADGTSSVPLRLAPALHIGLGRHFVQIVTECHATPLTSVHQDGEKVLLRQGIDAVVRLPGDGICRAVAGVPHVPPEGALAHQDRPCPLVSNHQTMKHGIDWLLAPALFASLRGGRPAMWKPRLVAATALLWATSDLSTLHERCVQARKIVRKVFRWQLAPGVSYQGFVKMLDKGHAELLGVVVPHLREQLRDGPPAQWQTAGYAVFAADGSCPKMPGKRWE